MQRWDACSVILLADKFPNIFACYTIVTEQGEFLCFAVAQLFNDAAEFLTVIIDKVALIRSVFRAPFVRRVLRRRPFAPTDQAL